MKPLAPDDFSQEYFVHNCGGTEEIALWDREHGAVLSERLQRIWDAARIRPTDFVLDLGGGRGELTLHAARVASRVVFVDFAPSACTIAEKLLGGLPNAEVVCKDATIFCEQYTGPRFDVVLASDLLAHLTDDQRGCLFAALRNILAPGGRVVVGVVAHENYRPQASGHYALYVNVFDDTEAVRRFGIEHGFSVASERTDHGKALIVFTL